MRGTAGTGFPDQCQERRILRLALFLLWAASGPQDKTKRPAPDLVKRAIVPDVSLGSHTASLALLFYTKMAFPAKYQGGAFIGQHGSWNRSVLTGYRVAFVPFKDGKPVGEREDFLTGFIANADKEEVY